MFYQYPVELFKSHLIPPLYSNIAHSAATKKNTIHVTLAFCKALMPMLLCSTEGQHFGHCLQDDKQIKHERLPFDVVEIILQLDQRIIA